ncbi:MAG: asparagine synthase (glutamine-hydrolyzing) [Alphaproteobacteria bacterium]|nr:asparagine synthase (glutamine-hydrolyzing) [Alphaproteobacteria bacterium]
MCGIAGHIGGRPAGARVAARVLAAMRNRGPDGSGWIAASVGQTPVALFHTRLAILDPEARSDQPFVRDGLTLIYNGELYNHHALRRDLQARGARFTTEGDTEVVLEAYRQWGRAAEERFEGMWALALFDSRAGSLWLSRDRFGEKPLYLWPYRGALYFASEIKALAAMAGAWPDVNRRQIRRYLVNGYKALYTRGEGFYEGVSELPAAHSLEIMLSGLDADRLSPKPYWRLSYQPEEISAEAAQERVDALVEQAIDRRLLSDAPLAIRLSGGVDSNVIAGVALKKFGRDVATFSAISDDPRYDESAAIDEAARYFNGRHHRVRIAKAGFLDRLTRMVNAFDGPPMTISYYIHALVSEAIHERGYKVALGGTGADEIFTGYYDHYLFWLASQAALDTGAGAAERHADRAAAWRDSYGQFVRNPYLQNPEAFIDAPDDRRHIFLGADRFSGFLKAPFDESHEERAYCDDILRNRMLNEIGAETVPVMLHDDDLAAMMVSVENRAAFLDTDLARFLFTVPSRHLVQDGLPKALLRKAGRGLAPPSILENPRKQGINAPVGDFVDFADPDVKERILSDGPLYDIVDRGKVEALLGSALSVNSESKFVFSLISAKLFLDRQAGLAAAPLGDA